jgi:peptidoglycan/LPS O-acetylase OafA/YrhL
VIRSLTSFRFITAFVVFLFHCNIHFGWRTNVSFCDMFFQNGAVFMTGFFVLSGFIMAHVYGETKFSERQNVWRFYWKRFAKIYPTYVVSTIVFLAASSLFLKDVNFWHAIDPKQWARIAINNPFLVQGFFPTMFDIANNGGTWSLTVEGFLYFLFPFLLFLSGKSPRILWIASVFAILITLNLQFEKQDYIYANPIMRLADFMFGMGFYFLKDRIRLLPYRAVLHVLTVVLLLYVCKQLAGPQYMRGQFLVAPLFGLWITFVYYSSNIFYNNRVSEYLGKISYSFYLWQFVAILPSKAIVDYYPEINRYWLVGAAFFVNFMVSALSYHLVEEPARKHILNKVLPRFSKK